jgi:hypothetical protein
MRTLSTATKFMEILPGPVARAMLAAMSFKPYGKKIGPLCSVAVKLGQTAVYAPEHELWGVVTCDECREKFVIGPHRIHGSRIGEQDCAKRLEALLNEDHKQNRPHADSYEIPD